MPDFFKGFPGTQSPACQKNTPASGSFLNFKKKELLPLRRLPFPWKPFPEVLPDPAVMLPEVPVHRGVKRDEPDFPVTVKK
jgi:hypothetical protein